MAYLELDVAEPTALGTVSRRCLFGHASDLIARMVSIPVQLAQRGGGGIYKGRKERSML